MSCKKKMMILGAGIYQVPLIEKAKEMGLETIVVSRDGDYPGFTIADKSLHIDTTDIEGILQAAREEGIDGIVTAGSDVCVPAIGRVCDELGLPGISYEAAISSSVKRDMKAAFEAHGVPTAEYRMAHDLESAMEALEGIRGKALVKAIDSSGSRGITVLEENRTREDVEDAIRAVREATRADEFIVERFIEGEEFGAQALVAKGEVVFVLPHGDDVFVGDTGVPVGHHAPIQLDDETVRSIEETVIAGIRALGLDDCAVNVDCILSDGQVYVIELAGRVGATCLAEIVSIRYGIDYYETLLRTALGMEVGSFDPGNGAPAFGRLVTSDVSGVIESVTLPDDDDPRIIQLSLDYGPGDRIEAFRTGPDRIGQVVATGETVQDAEEAVERAIRGLGIVLREE